MQESLTHTLQPSLETPPVYRRFFGGAQSLRLATAEVVVIAGLGILTALISAVTADSRPAWEVASGGLAATIAALSTATIAARWLGSWIGLFSGCLYLISGQILFATATSGDRWLAAMGTTAVAAFAAANVAGRLPLVSGRLPAGLFYALAAAILFFNGPVSAVSIAVVCVLVLVSVRNGRGMRFFADPPGIVVLAAAALAAWLAPGPGWAAAGNAAWSGGRVLSVESWPQDIDGFVYLLAARMPFDMLPWSPLVLVAIVVGIHQGHYSTPFGRFLTVWLLAPLGMAPAGLIGQDTAAVLVFPPLSILAGIGLVELRVKIARLRN